MKATITQCDLSPHSFVLMIRYCANLKAIRYESTSLNRIVADKSHRVNVAEVNQLLLGDNKALFSPAFTPTLERQSVTYYKTIFEFYAI